MTMTSHVCPNFSWDPGGETLSIRAAQATTLTVADWLGTYSKHPASSDVFTGGSYHPHLRALKGIWAALSSQTFARGGLKLYPNPASLINMVYTSPNTPSLPSYNFIATELWKQVLWRTTSSWVLQPSVCSQLLHPSSQHHGADTPPPTSTLSPFNSGSPCYPGQCFQLLYPSPSFSVPIPCGDSFEGPCK